MSPPIVKETTAAESEKERERGRERERFTRHCR
jgi:hypothetical protein